MSALALLKMAMHANSGGNIEVMGILQGKVMKDTFIVIDVFALPVEGSETRVNAQAEAYEFMIDFMETCKVRCSLCRLQEIGPQRTGHACMQASMQHISCQARLRMQGKP